MAEKNKKLTPFEKEQIETAKKVLEYKVGAEANVVSIIYKRPDLIYNTNLSIEDFHDNAWRVYFEIAREIILVEKKNTLDEITIGLFLEKHNKLKTKYEEYNGFETIKAAKGYIDISNFDGYITELRKWSAIIKLIKRGFPVKDRLSDYADMTAEEIYSEFEVYLNDTFVNIDSDIKSYDICDGIHELIEDLDSGSAVGLPYDSLPTLTKETNGQWLGSITLLGGLSNAGKEQPVSEPVLTEHGWKPMGEIIIGMKVYGRDGQLHTVTGVYPQGVKDVYKVIFNDGTFTRCGLEHLWQVETQKQRQKNMRDNGNRHKILPLKDIIKDYKKEYISNSKSGLRKITQHKYSIPLCKPINFNNNATLPIDAYALGLLLGDGGFTQNVPTFTNSEDELFNELAYAVKDLNIEMHYHTDYINHKQCTLVCKDKSHFNILTSKLKELELWGCGSREKFIPDIYKYSSIENRAKVLSGIINTDGSVEQPSCSSIVVTTYSKQMSEDIGEIARSLGFKTKVFEADRTDESSSSKYNKEISYGIRICSNDFSILSLSTKHKSKLCTLKDSRVKKIIDIEYVGREESQCLMLDSDEHLYITKDYIVTHNTTIARSAVIPSIIKYNEKVVVMINEDALSKWQREMIVWICNNILNFDIQKHVVRDGKYSKEVKEKLHEAADWLEEHTQNHTITIIPFIQYQTAKAIKEIKKYANMGVKYFVLDTFKMDAGDTGNNVWIKMQQAMVDIKNTVKTEALNVHILITFQLEKGSSVMRYYTQNNVGMAKNIVDVASTVIMIRDIFEDEYTDEKRALKVYRLEGKNGKTKVQVKLDKDKRYQVLFIVKNQEGSANAYQLVINHDKSRNIIKEVGITNVLPDNF